MSKKRFSLAIYETDFYTFKMRAADRNQSIAECFHDLLHSKGPEQPVQPEIVARDDERFAKLEEAIKKHHEQLAKLQSVLFDVQVQVEVLEKASAQYSWYDKELLRLDDTIKSVIKGNDLEFSQLQAGIKCSDLQFAQLQADIKRIESSATSVSTAQYEAQAAQIEELTKRNEALTKKCDAQIEEFLKLNQDKIAMALTIEEKDIKISSLEAVVKDADPSNQLFNSQRREEKTRITASNLHKRIKDYEAIDPQLPDKLKAKEERAAIERRGLLSRLGDDADY